MATQAMMSLNTLLAGEGFDATKPVTVGGSSSDGAAAGGVGGGNSGASTIGGGVSIDLKSLMIGWGNGTMVGGKGKG